jgi:nicotinamide riboside kinase
MKRNKIWTIAGAESSGKTTLFNHCQLLLPDFQCIPELDREWLENQKMFPPFDSDLLGTLFKNCIQRYQKITFHQSTILDTDLLNLYIWAAHIQHPLEAELFDAWKAQEKRIYILCPPNIPYESDPLRTNEETRNWVWKKHQQLLQNESCITLKSNTLMGRWKEIKDLLSSDGSNSR